MNQNMEKYLAVKKRFEEQEDRENAVKMSRYMRELFPFYGLPTPKRRALYRDFLRQERKPEGSTGLSSTSATQTSTGNSSIWRGTT